MRYLQDTEPGAGRLDTEQVAGRLDTESGAGWLDTEPGAGLLDTGASVGRLDTGSDASNQTENKAVLAACSGFLKGPESDAGMIHVLPDTKKMGERLKLISHDCSNAKDTNSDTENIDWHQIPRN